MYNEIDLDKIDINSVPPMDEPARQHYYMAKCREWVKEFKQKNGRPPQFCVTTFGCQMNAKDSEKLAGILSAIGYEESESEEADLVLYNTCTVRENANTRVYGRIGYLGNLKKRKNREMKIVLCGCMMQEAHVVEKIRKSYPFVDLIFGTHNIYKLAELLYRRLNSPKMVVEISEEAGRIVEELPSELKFGFKAGVNIMYGCNNFCSYCIVPYVRGRERSRKPEDIISEIEGLVAQGVTEVMLLGQNVNSYGKTLVQPVSFAELLRRVEKIEGLRRIRFMTPHPKDLSDELIEVMKKSEKICRHVHLPVQSGSSRLLAKMNRHYTKEDYIVLTGKIQSAMPDAAITTDIIVGFPGETEEDFQDTLDVVRRVKFCSAYTFLYSPRTGTPAASMPDQIPEETAKERFDRLIKEVQRISAEFAERAAGSIAEVLVEEEKEPGSGLLTGRLSNNLLVHFPGDRALLGSYVRVRLSECKGFYYLGELATDGLHP
ncbi:MAG: tRNA (N6-isopentenyl adenosine(37)-C2)-methylthiotransferase MiaB, partial [Lachnospiraceae bacterium]|nr:tRNA (N6-isopentenyl adenosine(37)-C2)-methylthiotransferase MiaB [Lachnospiraceae bacterium]